MENLAQVPGSAGIQAVLSKYPDAGEDQLNALLQDVQDPRRGTGDRGARRAQAGQSGLNSV